MTTVFLVTVSILSLSLHSVERLPYQVSLIVLHISYVSRFCATFNGQCINEYMFNRFESNLSDFLVVICNFGC